MIQMRDEKLFKNIEKVEDIKNLKERLMLYKGILNKNIYNYINSLIELEISILKEDNISKDDMNVLMQFNLYKEIAIYNIYMRTLNLIKKHSNDFNISINTDKNQGLYVSGINNNKIFDIFNFNYSDYLNINLYEYINNPIQRKKEKKRLLYILERLYNEKNPYKLISTSTSGLINMWDFEHNKEIKKYEDIYDELDRRDLMDESELYISNIQNYFSQLIIENLGIENNFTEIIDDTISDSELNKQLVKEYPNIKVNRNIKYF